jgi:hypothetical protein
MPANEQLSDDAIDELTELIAEAFGPTDFEMFVRNSVSLKLEKIVVAQSTFVQQVHYFLRHFNGTVIVTLLLHDMLEKKASQPSLCETIRRRCPWAEKAQPSLGVQAQKLAVGLEISRKLLAIPAVRKVVGKFRKKLTELGDEVDNLANYKALHDSLHEVQLYRYPYVVKLVKTFRDQPDDLTELESHIQQLQAICEDARRAAESLPTIVGVRADEVRWVTKLETAVSNLRSAVDRLDDQLAFQAARSLAEVIRKEPPRINTRLTLIAQTLPLEELKQTLEDVATAAGTSTLELQEAQRSLENIIPRLRGRVAEHEQWQEVENEFWGANEFVEQGSPESIKEFDQLWPSVKSHVGILARADSDADWAKRSLDVAAQTHPI